MDSELRKGLALRGRVKSTHRASDAPASRVGVALSKPRLLHLGHRTLVGAMGPPGPGSVWRLQVWRALAKSTLEASLELALRALAVPKLANGKVAARVAGQDVGPPTGRALCKVQDGTGKVTTWYEKGDQVSKPGPGKGDHIDMV